MMARQPLHSKRPVIPDTEKKWMTCLRCGEKMWTDRCHRICKKCQRRHAVTHPARPPYHVRLPNSKEHDEQD